MVEISGAKNNAAPILAATLLSKESFSIDNLPLVGDVLNMIKLLESMGAEVEWLGANKVRIRAGEKVDPERLNLSLMGETRASVLLIGPLIARFRRFKISPPGGDRIGLRPITTHLEAFEKLGARIERAEDNYFFDGRGLKPQEVTLNEFSVTATENLVMTASLMEGKTIIRGAATEPHIRDLGETLKEMGVKINGIGQHTIEIEGQKELKGVHRRIIPDHVEAGTFAIIGALTAGTLEIKNVILEDLEIALSKLKEAGVIFERGENSFKVDFSPELKPIRIQALPWPGFPTDMLPIVVPLLTQARGRSLIHDPLYENRLNYVSELRKMGADIEIVDPHRAFVFGKTPLSGVKISSWDIRAGASLLVAALIAEGRTTIENISQIDRGYEKIDEKLKKVGADIQRVN